MTKLARSINLKVLMQRVEAAEKAIKEITKANENLLPMIQSIKRTISDIKPQEIEYNIGWIESK